MSYNVKDNNLIAELEDKCKLEFLRKVIFSAYICFSKHVFIATNSRHRAKIPKFSIFPKLFGCRGIHWRSQILRHIQIYLFHQLPTF